jgi:hypothetical protein
MRALYSLRSGAGTSGAGQAGSEPAGKEKEGVRGLGEADIRAEDVAISAGANLAFVSVIMSVCDPGDEVVIAVPWYFNQECVPPLPLPALHFPRVHMRMPSPPPSFTTAAPLLLLPPLVGARAHIAPGRC